jgi:hypothetical protein
MLSALLLCTVPVHAATFWDDELESGNTGYETLFSKPDCGGLPSFVNDTTLKVSGTASMKENFPGTPQYHQLCGGFSDRSFTASSEIWTRFYIRLSPGFIVDFIETKIMFNQEHPEVGGSLWMFPSLRNGTNSISISVNNYPATGETRVFSANIGSGALPYGQFACIESHFKNNTVGYANGVIEVWKDGNQFINYTGLEFLKIAQGNQDALFDTIRMYRQDGGGSINYDRLAVGNTRIGCLGSVPTNDTTPPAAPDGLFVR